MFTLFLEAIPNPDNSYKIVWETPDGEFHQLESGDLSSAGVHVVNRSDGGVTRPVMALRNEDGHDATLYLSLEGFGTPAGVILFRSGDDFPRKFYYAYDGHNHNVLGMPALVLRAQGARRTPFDLDDELKLRPIGEDANPPVNLRVGVMRMRPDPRHANTVTPA